MVKLFGLTKIDSENSGKKLLRKKMRYSTRLLSEYRAHNNSKRRTSNFNTVDSGMVYLVAFLPNHEQIPTRITTLFGQMRKNCTQILRHTL